MKNETLKEKIYRVKWRMYHCLMDLDEFRKRHEVYIERKYTSKDYLLYINAGLAYNEKRFASLSQDLKDLTGSTESNGDIEFHEGILALMSQLFEDLMLLSQDLKGLWDSVES
jgi:hypothetical protein